MYLYGWGRWRTVCICIYVYASVVLGAGDHAHTCILCTPAELKCHAQEELCALQKRIASSARLFSKDEQEK